MIPKIPNRYGAAIVTETVTTLAALDASGITLGSMAYVSGADLYFVLKVSSAALVPNQVVAVAGTTGSRWLVEADVLTAITSLTGDGTASGPGAAAFVLANIPTTATMAGKVTATAIAAPGTPAAGKGAIYVDSTSKNLAVKDDAGVVKHGVQSMTTALKVVTAISDAGAVSTADLTAAGAALIDDANAAAQRTTLGLAAIAASGSGADLSAGTVANAALANMAATTVKGSVAGGVPADLSQTQLTALLNAASASLPGSMSVADFNKLATVPTGTGILSVAMTVAIDLMAAAADYVMLPAMPFRISTVTQQWEIKTTGGTISTSPTFSLGTDASFANLSASQTKAGFLSQAAETAVPISFNIAPVNWADLTANGLKLRIIAPGTGVSPVLTAIAWVTFFLLPV